MKKMFDKEHIWTSIGSILGIIFFALMIVGLISSTEKDALNEAWAAISAAIPGGDFTVIAGAVMSFIMVIVGLFTKDPKPDK